MSVIEGLMGTYDTLSSCNNTMSSLSKFQEGHFAIVTRLNHNDGAYGNRLITGMNTAGNPATINVSYGGSSAATITPIAWAVCTSVLRIGAYKQVEVDA